MYFSWTLEPIRVNTSLHRNARFLCNLPTSRFDGLQGGAPQFEARSNDKLDNRPSQTLSLNRSSFHVFQVLRRLWGGNGSSVVTEHRHYRRSDFGIERPKFLHLI